MNEILRRAMLHAHLDEVDVATCLEVDPKTVRRWLEGRLPYTRHRWALAELLNLEETVIWPELCTSPRRPGELIAVYPQRSSIAPDIWQKFFASAKNEISILDYSSLFLDADTAFTPILAEQAFRGVRIRIALGGSNDQFVAQHTGLQATGDVATISSFRIRYQQLSEIEHVEIRFYSAILYNSIYRADSNILVHQHVYGIPQGHGPVLHLSLQRYGEMGSIYLDSFERTWSAASA